MYSEPSSGIKLTAYSCICWFFHRIYYDARNHKHKIPRSNFVLTDTYHTNFTERILVFYGYRTFDTEKNCHVTCLLSVIPNIRSLTVCVLDTPPPLQLLTLKHRPAVGLGVAWSWCSAETRHWSQLAHTQLPHWCNRGFAVHNHSCHSRELGMQHRLGSHHCNLRKENGFVLYPTIQNWIYEEEDW